jgi:hypothetical protein
MRSGNERAVRWRMMRVATVAEDASHTVCGIFGLLLVCVRAYFDLDGCHNLL